jgi:hypothetical protein
MKKSHLLMVAGLVASLTACAQRQVIVAVPVDSAALNNAAVAKQCVSPEDKQTTYFTAQSVVSAGMVAPPHASAEHRSGCAAVKFQLTPDGKATNVAILREYPQGYGYGQALAESIQRSTYKPPIGVNDWFFVNVAHAYPGSL